MALLASSHASILSPRMRHPGMTSTLERCALFWTSWVAMLTSAVAVCVSDPRDPGGEAAEVRCGVCKMAVRKNSKHCYKCKYCVDDFDHHCMWLNVCIGGRNYARFCTVLGLWVWTNGLMVIDTAVEARLVFRSSGWCQRSSLLTAVSLAFLPGFVMGVDLIRFHVRLMAKRMTTYQYYKKCHPSAPIPSELWVEVDAPDGETVPSFAIAAFNELPHRRYCQLVTLLSSQR